MQFDLSKHWKENDKPIHFVHNFTDVRENIEVVAGGDIIENNTLPSKGKGNRRAGDNVVYNQSDVRQMELWVDGKNKSRRSIKLVGYRCKKWCPGGVEEKPLETTVRRWSNPEAWPTGRVPAEGDEVLVESGWNMLYDIEESPIFGKIEINGRLTFEDGVKDLHLRAKSIWVRAGELVIGNSTHPFQKTAKITLHGEKADEHLLIDNLVETGNKVLVNTNRIELYGKARHTHSRLTREVYPGSSTIFVATGLDWVAGDKIGIAPTGMRYNDTDFAIISAYNSATGEVTLDRPLTAYHYGASTSTASTYGGIVDIRGEVLMLTRNIKIAGEDVDAWGC